MKRGFDGWMDVGERRVKSVLRTYGACTEKQLQLKICEAGPYNQRIEPIILDSVGNKMFREGELLFSDIFLNENKKITVCYLKENENVDMGNRFESLKEFYKVYYSKVELQSAILCGNVLEKMIIDAIKDTNKYIFFSNIYSDFEDGIKVVGNGNLTIYNGKYTSNPLDCIAIIKENNIPLGIEIKNKTEWKYGSDIDIWKMIKKCCELDLLPIFVARKIPAITKFFFEKAGILGMETQFQYLHESCKVEMENIIKKDKLGYAHIKFESKYRPFMKKYFETVLIEQSSKYYEKFKENKEILYSYSKELSEDINTKKRTRIYKEIREIIYGECDFFEDDI